MTKNIRAHLFVLAAVVWSLIPLIALAQGLVPCTGLDCQACHIAKLAQNVINFLVVVAIPIAAAIFAAAGFLYFTSGASPKNIDLAKGLFWNAFIGFLVAISAWLVVQTILRVTLSNEFYRGWNTIQCTTSERLMNKTVGDFLSTLPGLNTAPVQTSLTSFNNLWGGGQSCESGFTLINGLCYNDAGTVMEPTTSFYPSQVGRGDCSPGNLESIWGSNAAAASCIASNESNCNSVVSGDRGFSVGIYQINMTANNVVCNDRVLPCRMAFSEPYTCRTVNGVNTCTNPIVLNSSLASECRNALENTNCNSQTAVSLFQQRGWAPWTTRNRCGL